MHVTLIDRLQLLRSSLSTAPTNSYYFSILVLLDIDRE
jgi:hypothetical protein